MDDERRLPAEGLPTLRALVGPLPGVDPLVRDEGRPVAEGLLTAAARIGPLPSVCSLVISKNRPDKEGLLAPAAFVGLLSCVFLLMVSEGRRSGVSLATQIAREGFPPCLGRHAALPTSTVLTGPCRTGPPCVEGALLPPTFQMPLPSLGLGAVAEELTVCEGLPGHTVGTRLLCSATRDRHSRERHDLVHIQFLRSHHQRVSIIYHQI